MTQRCYYQNGATRCEATVLDCRAVEGGYEILTDRTAIFPEGGGQLSDTGSIGGVRVLHAREENGEVWHKTCAPIEKGTAVTIEAAEDARRDHTQQHSGEHILSGLASKLFGAVNVGFHMAEDYVTIDLDKLLTQEQLDILQLEANRAVQRNVPITYETVQGEELEHIKLRKQAKGLTGDIRIVYIDGGEVDSCTCCGTHVALAGEVGYIRITSHIKYKGGTRIWFACGMRAVAESMADKAAVDAIAVRFSAKTEDVVAAVERQGNELNAARRELHERTEKLLGYTAAELMASVQSIGGVKLVVDMREGMSIAELKRLAEKLTEDDNVLAVLFGTGTDTLCYQLSRGKNVKTSMRELIQAVNAAAGGKGGGRDEYAQGSARVTPSLDVQGMFTQVKSYCAAVLKG